MGSHFCSFKQGSKTLQKNVQYIPRLYVFIYASVNGKSVKTDSVLLGKCNCRIGNTSFGNNTFNICFYGVSSEALMIMTRKYCGVSNGSACTSNNYAPSYVLQAMGMAPELIDSSIRISWGPESDPELVRTEFLKLLASVKELI